MEFLTKIGCNVLSALPTWAKVSMWKHAPRTTSALDNKMTAAFGL